MTTETKKLRIRIVRDDNVEPPRWDPVSTFVTWHSRYTIGDDQPKYDPLDYMLHQLPDADRDAYEEWDDEYPSLVSADYNSAKYQEYYREYHAARAGWITERFEQHFHYLPVYAYEHGGITIRCGPFGDPWDSGQLGFIYVSKERAEKEWGGDPLEILRSEIKLYDQYLQGEVWGFQISEVQTCSLGHEHEEQIDSCYGFYGDKLDETGIWDYVSGSGVTEEQLEEAWRDRE